jgi:uncharacterized protein YqeY
MIEKYRKDLMQAMKDKDNIKKVVLQMLITGYVNKTKDVHRELTEDEVITIINKELKQTKEALESFKLGNRADLVAESEGKIKVLESYLPQQLSEAEVEKIVSDIAMTTTLGPDPNRNLGVVMKLVMPQLKGKADGKVINQIVAKVLGL